MKKDSSPHSRIVFRVGFEWVMNAYKNEANNTFNYDKRSTDGTPDENWNKAIANKAFRQCFSKGLELSKFYAHSIFIMTY